VAASLDKHSTLHLPLHNSCGNRICPICGTTRIVASRRTPYHQLPTPYCRECVTGNASSKASA
jgi:hypothetical protein